MGIINQSQSVGFSQQAEEIKRAQALAAELMKSSMPDPNQMVSGRVVKLNPLTALINGLSEGYGSYLDAKSHKDAAKLEESKTAKLNELAQSGDVDPQKMAQAGLISPEQYAMALLKRHESAGGQPYHTALPSEGGYVDFDARTGLGKKLIIDGQGLSKGTDSPRLQGEIAAAKEGEQITPQTVNGIENVPMKNKDALAALLQGNPIPNQATQGNVMPFNAVPPEFSNQPPLSPRQAESLPNAQPTPQEQQMFSGGNRFPNIGSNPYAKQNALEEIKKTQVLDQKSKEVPINLNEAQGKADIENAKNIQLEQLKSAQDYPTKASAIDSQIKFIDEMVSHPGLKTAVGVPSILHLSSIPGTQAANFSARLDQIKGQSFLQAFDRLRGGGQITNPEGEKATAAIARLSTAQTQDEFKQSLADLKEILEIGRKNLAKKAGIKTESTTNNAEQTISPDDLVKHYLGGK